MILADPDFYNIEKWEDVDEEESSIDTFTEPMMVMYVRRMSYLDAKGEIDDYVEP